jgi:hypothetical protein
MPASSATSVQPSAGGRQSNPHVVSSDTFAGRTNRQSSENTRVRRKSHAGIKLVADATLEGSESQLAGVKEINNASKVLKTHEMEQELQIHQEEMLYR